MEMYLDDLVDWVFTLSPLSIYTIFFIVAYTENVAPPIPGDVLVAFGGYLAAERLVDFPTLLILTTVASVFGFMTMYAFGSFWGYRIDEQRESFWLMRFIDMKYFDRGRRWMQKWGQWVIVANRFLAGTRSVIAITAGIYRTKVNYTILSSTISSLLWNSILLGFGWFVHENWQVIGDYLGYYGWLILALIILAVLVRIYKVTKVRKKNKKSI
jgi:membrane protein DedA with SNARE-associated domain